MKFQIERKEVKLETVDIEFPIYSYIEEDDCTLYTKITLDKFYQIKTYFNEVSVSSHKWTCHSINEAWYNSRCDEKQFQEGLDILKSYLENV